MWRHTGEEEGDNWICLVALYVLSGPCSYRINNNETEVRTGSTNGK